MSNYTYVGSELELFRAATNWKNYYSRMIFPYLGEDVLEVGAGIGGTTQVLCRRSHGRWICLEPDSNLVERFKSEPNLPEQCEIRQGSLANLLEGECFDTVLYIDVLEHIEDDFAEMQSASRFLKPGGFLLSYLLPISGYFQHSIDQSVTIVAIRNQV